MEKRPEDTLSLTRGVPFCSTFRVSIIIPTHNSSQHVGATIESLLQQRNCRWDAIFVDADSDDRTLEIIRSYESQKIRLQQVPSSHVFEMINRGIAMAQGEYVSVLFPGDTYLYPDALALIMWKIAENDFPDLFYTASTSYDETMKSNLIFRPMKKETLRQGLLPATLQSSWIKKSIFKSVGYFGTEFEVCGTLDFFLRLIKIKDVRVASEQRVYVDTVSTLLTYSTALQMVKETFSILRHHFGIFTAISWFLKQKEAKMLLSRLIQKLKNSFFKK